MASPAAGSGLALEPAAKGVETPVTKQVSEWLSPRPSPRTAQFCAAGLGAARPAPLPSLQAGCEPENFLLRAGFAGDGGRGGRGPRVPGGKQEVTAAVEPACERRPGLMEVEWGLDRAP